MSSIEYCIYYFHFRYPISELPASEAGLKEWLNDLWQQKEHKLNDFYTQCTFIPGLTTTDNHKPKHRQPICNALLLALIFWSALIMCTLYAVCVSTYVQIWCVFHCILFAIISATTEGIQQLEVSWFKKKLGGNETNNKVN